MSQYRINTRVSDSHDKLIALPLAIITIFCFSFVLMQPVLKPEKQAAAARGSNLTTSNNDKLSPIHVASPSTLNKLNTGTYNQQSQGGSGSSTANSLQSAGQNEHASDKSVIMRVTKSVEQALESH